MLIPEKSLTKNQEKEILSSVIQSKLDQKTKGGKSLSGIDLEKIRERPLQKYSKEDYKVEINASCKAL